MRRKGVCAFCGMEVVDGREESGWTGIGPDWMVNGDFGCGDNPINDDEGTGGHRTEEELRTLYILAETEESFTGIWDVVRRRLY